MSELTQRRCVPCEGGMPAVTGADLERLHAQIPSWTVREDGKELERTFPFPTYWQTMAFVNAVAWIAHQEDHHPDMSVHYGKVIVRWSTHAIGGLSENDFIGAAKVDALLSQS
jgi:4a-hydroxytetrahydrobiopterin dehydratase